MKSAFRLSVIRIGLILILMEGTLPMSLFAEQPDVSSPFVPDPDTVTRNGPGWRFPQDGWIVVHIEGTPYERGYQHGSLLAPEIVDYCHTIAKVRSHEAPDKAWKDLRLFVNALFLRRFDNEYLKEMQGIADGAAAAGAKLDDRPVDLIDIVIINADIELGYLESSLEATATGIDRVYFRGRHGSTPKALHRDRCSAFVATGPATRDGKIVAGHITMTDLYNARFFNVWLDIQPSTGHRIVFQAYPGGIQSGLDYYITGAGLIISETTMEQTKFNPAGEMLASRIRRAAQYADSIERCEAILTSSSNGLYTNEWLIGDTKTNEIAMFELGTHTTRTWRSSRNEWVAGTKGFYWGCNNVKDLGVFKETVADFGGKPENLVLHPRIRDQAWIKLFFKHQGTLDPAFGFEAFSTPPIAAFPSCDAKITTAGMAKEFQSWAMFGPPLGKTWMPSKSDREDLPSIEPLIANDWTLLDVHHVKLPPAKTGADAKHRPVDLEMFPKKDNSLSVEFDANHPFAWRGTLLPTTDADIWLAAAFSDFEKIVSLEQAIVRHDHEEDEHSSSSTSDSDDSEHSETHSAPSHDNASQEGKDLMALALFQHKSKWLTAARRIGRDIPLAETKSDPASSDWYRIAAGKGVMLLAALRKQMGPDRFQHCLDEFGQAHAGEAVSTDQFRQHLLKTADADAVEILNRWYSKEVLEDFESHNPWSIFSHEVEPEHVLVIYGTLRDKAAQKEAAEHLQTEVMRRFANVAPTVKADRDVTDDDLSSHYLLLVGRPSTNRVTAHCLRNTPRFPLTFGSQSFRIGDDVYAHPKTFVVAAGENPFNPRYSMVICAGLNATSTWNSVRDLPEETEPNPQILLHASGKKQRAFNVSPSK